MLTAAKAPWARLPKESKPVYEAFRIYLEMGPDRTLDRVCRELSKSMPLLKRWSYTHNWTERTAAWDEHLGELARRQIEKQAETSATKWLRARDEILDESLDNGSLLIKQARYLAGFPVVDQKVTDGGRTTVFTAVEPKLLVAAAKIMESGQRIKFDTLDRALRGLGAESSGPVASGPTQPVGVDGLRPDQIAQAQRELAAFETRQREAAAAFLAMPPPGPIQPAPSV